MRTVRRKLIPDKLSSTRWHFALTARGIITGLFVALTSIYAVRSAVVTAYVDTAVKDAAAVWEEHPDVLAALTLASIAEASASHELLPEASDRIAKLAEGAPLSPEPFIAAGAVAISAGKYEKAEQLLLAARTRAPRSTVTRYLLAELYWRQEQVGPALQELAAVRRLTPVLSAPLIEGLAEFVRRRGPIPEVRSILDADRQLKAAFLSALAADPANAEYILSLAGSQGGSGGTPAWVPKLVTSLVGVGEFRKAHALWLRFAPASDIRAPLWTFGEGESPSVFTWRFTEKSSGSAVPKGHLLEVYHSGRESVDLASRLVLLPTGSYVMSLNISGKPPSDGNVQWSVTCLPSGDKVAEIPITKTGRVEALFRLPGACIAQTIKLRGLAQSVPETSTLSISELSVVRGQAR